jgi:hypothetical protein
LWQFVEATYIIQAGKDLVVNLDVELFDNFDPIIVMANDIRNAVRDAKPDALIVALPALNVGSRR